MKHLLAVVVVLSLVVLASGQSDSVDAINLNLDEDDERRYYFCGTRSVSVFQSTTSNRAVNSKH
jgi:hypothetical protein